MPILRAGELSKLANQAKLTRAQAIRHVEGLERIYTHILTQQVNGEWKTPEGAAEELAALRLARCALEVSGTPMEGNQ